MALISCCQVEAVPRAIFVDRRRKELWLATGKGVLGYSL